MSTEAADFKGRDRKGTPLLVGVVRIAVGYLCIWMSGCGDGAIERLISRLHDSDPQVRRSAARALASADASDSRVVSALSGAASDADPLVQEAALVALGAMGGNAQPALASIERALEDPHPSVRLSAALAIPKINPKSTRHHQVIAAALAEGQAPVFLEVGSMGRAAEWAVPTLIGLLGSQKTHVRALSARALGEIGVVSDQVESALKRRLRDQEPAVRRQAEGALEALSKGSTPD